MIKTKTLLITMMATIVAASSPDPRGCHFKMICAASRRGVAKEMLEPLRGLRELKRAFMLGEKKIPSAAAESHSFLNLSVAAPSAPCSSLAPQCPHTDKELVQELASFSSSDPFNPGLSRTKRGATIHKFYAHEALDQETQLQEVFPQPRKRRRLR